MLIGERAEKGRNRGRLDIIRDVLSVALVEVRKTRIMYQANLSFDQLENYLKLLLAGGLLEREGNSMYLTTSKGQEYLQAYVKYLARCERVSQEIEQVVAERQALEGILQT